MKYQHIWNDNIKLWAPVVPKSACTLLKEHIFENGYNEDTGKSSYFNEIPSDYDCLIYVRHPRARVTSGLAEVYQRYLIKDKYTDIDQGRTLSKYNYQIEADFKRFINQNSFNDMLDFFTKFGEINVHIMPQIDVINWAELSESKVKITMIEVDRNVHINTMHWMKKRGSPLSEQTNIIANPALRSFHKAYFKGAFEALLLSNHNNFASDLNEYYSADMQFYNENKSSFYRGGEK